MKSLKTHCRYGHELNSETIYVSSKGHRVCRVCRGNCESKRAKHQRKVAAVSTAVRPSPDMIADAERRRRAISHQSF